MSSLRIVEKKHFEDLLGMSGGYALDFTNSTYADFFLETVGKDIYSDEYSFKGDSKANRLRAFWEVEPDTIVGRLLLALLEIWRYQNIMDGGERDPIYVGCLQIARRLCGEGKEQETRFIKQDFGDISVRELPIDTRLIPVLEYRVSETITCLQAGAPLAVVILCGSLLEGILLGVALENPEEFNRANSSPKYESGKVKPFRDWSLSQMITVAYELGFITENIKKFGDPLRDFRNYVHPNQQLESGFQPDEHTAELSFQVLKAAISCLSEERAVE